MQTVKIVFTDGKTEYIPCESYEYIGDYKMFFVLTKEKRIMIPREQVKIIGYVNFKEGGYL